MRIATPWKLSLYTLTNVDRATPFREATNEAFCVMTLYIQKFQQIHLQFFAGMQRIHEKGSESSQNQ